MLVKVAFVFLVFISMVDLNPFVHEGGAEKMWAARETNWIENKENPTFTFKSSPNLATLLPTPPPALDLPDSQKILASDVSLNLFAPERYHRPVPDLLKTMLLPPPPPTPTPTPAVAPGPGFHPRRIEILCHLDRIYVRILKSLFNNPEAWQYLRVGTCPVNEATTQHYYFLYYLNSCGVKRQETADTVIYSNTLKYEPVITGPVARELPFSVAWQCHYNKHHRIYQVGFHPIIQEDSLFWSLKGGFMLTPANDLWLPLSSWQSYVIGQPMYFEAKAPQSRRGKRLYLNKCHITSSPDVDSMPQYTVLDNYGCMVDSKQSTQAKFYVAEDKTTIRFSVAALVFKDMISQPEQKKIMYIHCEMALGNDTPTASAKSCLYNTETKRWTELYGDDSVCVCCDTTCPAPEPLAPTKMISSNPWGLV